MPPQRSTIVIFSRLIASAIIVALCAHEASAEPWFWWKKSDAAKSPAASSWPQPGPSNCAATRVQPIRPNANSAPEERHWWNRLSARKAKPVEKTRPPGDRPSNQTSLAAKPRSAMPRSTESFSAKDDDQSTDFEALKTQLRQSNDDIAVRPSTAARNEKVPLVIRRPRATVTDTSGANESISSVSHEAAERPGQSTRVWTPVRQAQGLTLPVEEHNPSSHIKLGPSELDDESISLTVRDAPLAIVLSMIAEQHGLNLVAGGDITGNVTVTLKDVKLDDAFNALLTVNGFSWNRNKNILIVSRIGNDNKISPSVRGVVMRVFKLNYVSGDDIEKVILTLLSPAGSAVVTLTDAKSDRRTREEIVVQDLPEYVERIESYIHQVDQPPREVLIEAHILQVTLADNCRHGVNLQELFDVGNTHVSLTTTGFANPKASPSFQFGLQNGQLNTLLETLKTTTDSKTLASPKLLCLNGQHARMQVGQSLGYLVTTTTTTSTLQNVSFLNVGVVLNVTPIITSEGNVMMFVKPEVSDGQISAQGLPQTNTTEVETAVLLADGQGMIIGGLIKEQDNEVQTKIPFLGDLWLVGRLFQQRTWLRQRNEIIIALVPHIVPYHDNTFCEPEPGIERVLTPLLEGPLIRVNRRQWEPEMPDAIRQPFHIFRLADPFAIDNGFSSEDIADDGEFESGSD